MKKCIGLPEIDQTINWGIPCCVRKSAPQALISGLIVEESSKGSPPGTPVLVETIVEFSTSIISSILTLSFLTLVSH